MTLAMLVLISVMWIPVALLFLGHGEAKGTGAATGIVGFLVVVAAMIQAAQGDPFGAGLIFAHGTLYLCVAYALLTGLEDMRSVGNVSLTVAIISAIYAYIWIFGTAKVPGVSYLGMCAVGYTVLTLEVWLNSYGKFSATLLAWSLIIWAVVGLWIPTFYLMTTGGLPF
jgi:putative amide transporter protein